MEKSPEQKKIKFSKYLRGKSIKTYNIQHEQSNSIFSSTDDKVELYYDIYLSITDFCLSWKKRKKRRKNPLDKFYKQVFKVTVADPFDVSKSGLA